MRRWLEVGIVALGMLVVMPVSATGEAMTFDQSQWATGDMNEQYASDSGGAVTSSHLDYFYYHERIPMCMKVIDDSLGAGSSARVYDSAILALVVTSEGLAGADSMRFFGKRLTHAWSENGVSWQYHHASSDSAWGSAGGDVNGSPCMDTLIVDVSLDAYDTLYFHLDTGFVRSMIEAVNVGWIMMAENIVDRAIVQFYTEDASTPAFRPTLTVYYTEGGSEAAVAGRRRGLAQRVLGGD